MPDLSLRLNKDMLVIMPLFTTELVDPYMDAHECLEFLNILDEDLIQETYRRFKLAGVQCACTNTLKAHRQALETWGLEKALSDINRKGVQLARQMGFEHIIAVLELAALDVLQEQAEALLLEEPDALMIVDPAVIPSENQAVIPSDNNPVIPSDNNPVIPSDNNPVIPSDNNPVIPSAARDLTPSEADTKNTLASEHDALELLRSLTQLPLISKTKGDILYIMGEDEAASLAWVQEQRATSDAPLMVCPSVSIKAMHLKSQENLELVRAEDALADFALATRQAGAQFLGTAPGTSPRFSGVLSATVTGLDTVVSLTQ